MKPVEMIIVPEAQEDIKRLDPKIRTRVFDKLEWIEQNARLIRHQPLQYSQHVGGKLTLYRQTLNLFNLQRI